MPKIRASLEIVAHWDVPADLCQHFANWLFVAAVAAYVVAFTGLSQVGWIVGLSLALLALACQAVVWRCRCRPVPAVVASFAAALGGAAAGAVVTFMARQHGQAVVIAALIGAIAVDAALCINAVLAALKWARDRAGRTATIYQFPGPGPKEIGHKGGRISRGSPGADRPPRRPDVRRGPPRHGRQ